MGLFSWLKKDSGEDEPEVLEEEEYLEEMSADDLYVDDVPLENTVITFTLRDLSRFDTDTVLENYDRLPYEFRLYLDTRRAFSRAFSTLCTELRSYDSCEGGRSAVYDEHYEFDDHDIDIFFTLARDGDHEPFRLTADIRVDGAEST